MANLADCEWLCSAAAADVLAAAAADARPLHQRLAALRTVHGPERAALVVELAAQRRRGVDKFAGLAARLFGTTTQWQQATDGWVAAYKAARFATLGAARVHDFCCGMGGDALALAARGPVVGWDSSDVAALFAQRNVADAFATANIQCADVTGVEPAATEAWHVDPDRRAGGERSIDPENHSPAPAVIDAWRRACPHGGVKLAPATRPWDQWQDDAQWEWISRDRQCRQLVAWFGDLQWHDAQPDSQRTAASRRATRITPATGNALGNGEQYDDKDDFANHFDHAVASFAGEPHESAEVADAPGAFLAEPDPAVIAAELVGALANAAGLATLGPSSVYLTGDRPPQSPLLAGFAIDAVLPLRPADVAKHLAARGVGTVEIKVRGVRHDPAAFRKRLKLRGDTTAAIVLTRIGQRETALVATRLSQ